MNRVAFVQNTARELWYDMVGYEKEPIRANDSIKLELELNPLVAKYSIDSVNGFYSNLRIVMKNGDTFSKNFFDY